MARSGAEARRFSVSAMPGFGAVAVGAFALLYVRVSSDRKAPGHG